ncbi:MFS transporter [Streptomyces sp. Rer75]|uniref:MFS transporter n=1 Tax=unclassified Streptomyces TaxID=2593676 RepID=UPI0015D08CA9|nr:MFS transporter [Streptomyces sp. Rer75]QLH25282.1 MFS transporter [Streptomyces sp. Rer75]
MRADRANLRACLVLLVVLPQATLAAFVPMVPHVAADLATSPAAIDRSLIVYMAGYAVSMAVAGGLAARTGPRTVQLAALAVHMVASVVVVLAPDAATLTAARAVQALGGGAGTVLARVYVQEALPEHQRLPALTQLSTAIALTPALTPPVVGLLVDHLPWRPVLLTLGALSASTFVLARRALPRSTAEAAEAAGPGLREVLARPAYWWFTGVICLAWCVYFTFTTYSSHTLQVELGTSATVFSLLYALVIVGYIAGSRIARRTSGRFGLPRILLVSGILALIATAAMAVGAHVLPHEPLALVVPMAVAMVGVGAAFPVCQAGMLRSAGVNARSASGLFFFLQMTSGALYTGLLSWWEPTQPGALSIAVLAPAAALAVLVTALRPATVGEPAQDHAGRRPEPPGDPSPAGPRRASR